jgi:ABC-type multidrug transport system ATPase subunit
VRPLTQRNVEEHLNDVGLAPEYGSHFRLSALSGGQKVKVVLAASLWNQPHIIILDEPTNYLDRESLGALSNAIEVFEGGVVMITHNNEFCSALCPETWILERGEDHIARIETKGDADWMAAKEAEMVSSEKMETMIDASGNETKLKDNRKLDRKEIKRLQKEIKAAEAAGDIDLAGELEERLQEGGGYDEANDLAALKVASDKAEADANAKKAKEAEAAAAEEEAAKAKAKELAAKKKAAAAEAAAKKKATEEKATAAAAAKRGELARRKAEEKAAAEKAAAEKAAVAAAAFQKAQEMRAAKEAAAAAAAPAEEEAAPAKATAASAPTAKAQPPQQKASKGKGGGKSKGKQATAAEAVAKPSSSKLVPMLALLAVMLAVLFKFFMPSQ